MLQLLALLRYSKRMKLQYVWNWKITRHKEFLTLNAEKLAVIGVGSTIDEARKPAILKCKGARIAFLAYNLVLPRAYWAEETRPGCVPFRAFTFYEQIEHDQQGTPCRVHTFYHKGDLAALVMISEEPDRRLTWSLFPRTGVSTLFLPRLPITRGR